MMLIPSLRYLDTVHITRLFHEGRIPLEHLTLMALPQINKREIIRKYRLMYKKDIDHRIIDAARGDTPKEQFVANVYQFSIQELLDHGATFRIYKGYLDLLGQHLGSLAGLEHIPDVEKVTILNLSNNQLTTLQPKIFQPLAPQLLTLDLSHNRLTTIPPDVFSGLSALQRLYLNHNHLTTIAPGVFQDLTQLKLLHLDHNDLTELKPGTFHGLTLLKSLSLNANQLTHLSSNIFHSIPQLEWFHLDHNHLATLPLSIFQNLINLKWLYLNHNFLKNLSPKTFEHTAKLKVLSIEANPMLSSKTIEQLRRTLPQVDLKV